MLTDAYQIRISTDTMPTAPALTDNKMDKNKQENNNNKNNDNNNNGLVHQILSPIWNSESTKFVNENLLFNWQTEKIHTSFEPNESFLSFSTAQTKKNLSEKNRETNW